MARPLLLIIVPTYNRANCLRLLLDTLLREIDGLHDRVAVLIGDNASPDETPDVTRAFKRTFPDATVIRHETNVGPDENFCRCIERADADYLWLMGDDDLPRAGAIRLLVEVLERSSPDLVYVGNRGLPELLDNDPSNPLRSIRPVAMSRIEFARRVNVWTTFISGIIVRSATFVDHATPQELRRHEKTNLVQLAWVFGTLARGGAMLHVAEPCVLATTGNTGGYAVLKVFGVNFPAITRQHFGDDSPITRVILRRCVIGFLPSLVWSVRTGTAGDFRLEDAAATLRPQLARFAAYRLLVWIAMAPRSIARATLVLCRLLHRGLLLSDRLRHGA